MQVAEAVYGDIIGSLFASTDSGEGSLLLSEKILEEDDLWQVEVITDWICALQTHLESMLEDRDLGEVEREMIVHWAKQRLESRVEAPDA